MRAEETFYGSCGATLTPTSATILSTNSSRTPEIDTKPQPTADPESNNPSMAPPSGLDGQAMPAIGVQTIVPPTGAQTPIPGVVVQHPAGLPPPPSGRLDIAPGAYVYTGPPLAPNVLGRAEWLLDEAVPNCMRCGEQFTVFTRRHHCRQCGQIFCSRCCNSKALLQPDSGTEPQARAAAHWFFGEQETDVLKPQKVCSKCFDLLLPMQPYLTSTGSKAVQEPDFSAPRWQEWIGKPISRSFKLEIKKAVHNLNSFLGMPDDAVVRKLIDAAHGIALLSVVKLTFLGGLQGGGGLVLARDRTSKQWLAPCSVGCAGVSAGFQAGGELNTVLLILNTAEAVDSFSGSASVTLGANLSVALGPIGRAIEGTGVAGNDAHAACYSYSVSRGLYAGVGVDGLCVFTRDRLNHVFYGHPASAKQLLSGRIAPPRAAEPLYRALRTHTSEYVP